MMKGIKYPAGHGGRSARYPLAVAASAFQSFSLDRDLRQISNFTVDPIVVSWRVDDVAIPDTNKMVSASAKCRLNAGRASGGGYDWRYIGDC